MDGGIGVDTVEKEKILQDARNVYLLHIQYRFVLGDYYSFLPIKTICIGKLDLYNKF